MSCKTELMDKIEKLHPPRASYHEPCPPPTHPFRRARRMSHSAPSCRPTPALEQGGGAGGARIAGALPHIAPRSSCRPTPTSEQGGGADSGGREGGIRGPASWPAANVQAADAAVAERGCRV
ncbi:hypothetical protein B0H14DRAFT_3530558 [Mycena olivaceomarginata]|nr:hypothetical protein B0H14DRAFT_3530558 [Mycena olivaceomarginata]